MADDKSRSGRQDRQRIHVDEDPALRDWAAKFGIAIQQVKQAVAKRDERTAEVQQHLKDPRG